MVFRARAGVDTGGTFTDLIFHDGSAFKSLKVFSTRENPANGILEGLSRLVPPNESSHLEVIHGTTVATNSLIERRGARVALITTEGFEDLLEIGRQARPRLYDLKARREPPLVPRERRFGVPERTDPSGRILRRPSRAVLEGLKKNVRKSGAESIALCFLFSFRNPANEKLAADALKALGLPISVSHEILPEFREYERLSTVTVNAYLAPMMHRYLAELENRLKPELKLNLTCSGFAGPKSLQPNVHRVATAVAGFRERIPPADGRPAKAAKRALHRYASSRVYVMQSSGGIAAVERIRMEPVRTILSGPAGGVVAAEWLAGLLGLRKVISLDMGGTSTDVHLLDASSRLTREAEAGSLAVAVPVLDIHCVGAGGGSIARMDAGGALRVGPQSAGAEPGPACYGRGGEQPTVTDANLILGRLDALHFLGGEYRLDERAARECFSRFLNPGGKSKSRPAAFGGSIFKLAEGIVTVANAAMERALRVVSVERGHDPREFALISFGGAGGLHAAALANALQIRRVVVPQNPGAFSALGLLLADVVRDLSVSVLLPVPRAPDPKGPATSERFWRELGSRFRQLEIEGRKALSQEGFNGRRARAERRLDVRYAGQGYELSVPMSPRFADDFHQEHFRAHGHSEPGRPIEIVSLRVRLAITTPKPRVAAQRLKKPDPTPAAMGKKPVWHNGKAWPAMIYDRGRLDAGMRIQGPAVITEYGSTTFVPPGFECRVDPFLNLILEPYAR
jgi:N-methylhydantoinase A